MASEPVRPVTQSRREFVGQPSECELTDRHLLDRFVAARDEAAFAALVQRHGPMVLAVCGRILRDAHEAEDAFQATFLVLVHKARSIGRPELLGAWLHGVAYRAAAQARQAARRRAREREAVAMPQDDPSVEVMWRDLRGVLDEELGRLAHKYRAPLVLVYLEGKSTEEAARLIGCPKGTVLSRLARGRDRLRDRLVRRGVALSVGALVVALVEKAAPAAVPAFVAEGVVKAAVLTAAGKAASGAIPASVVALTKGVLRSMFLSKMKVLLAVVVAVAVTLTCTAVFGGLALADKPAAGKDADQKDEEKIVGTWLAVSCEEGGKKVPEEKVKEARLILAADGKLTHDFGKRDKSGTYKLDPAKKPKEFTVSTNGGETLNGIYKLDGDTLTICANGVDGGERPTEFASKDGTQVLLLALKREKK
jgi:RNA polymerase sigma factor (sigma-70 family)